ncbi:bifunctional (p)ppGpp synthetase/guanosine-3',5'-bis(diphosphate) 3'-pyrophosphohydrolase [Candidatus Woesearchaeota archaeon]|nr:bifunctional (p)ppGpp synthetase/guanosine-3',5'-bis(diphosphate) 3'-pyrophosphohydrolase [Candidatus Woesearchaeota archaeon]
MKLKDLIKRVMRYNKNSNIVLIEKAYNYSESIVRDKLRASGRPWIEHYLDVAYETSKLNMDDNSIAAALMHGILNKGGKIKYIENIFGKNIVGILENIERMSDRKRNITKSTKDIEGVRKVLLAASKDLRSLLIKICDKIVNLREIEFLEENNRKKIANEVMNIYAPISYRLGLGKIKSEMEDLAFKTLDKKTYEKIENQVNKIRKDAERALFKIKNTLNSELEKEGIEVEIDVRVKHIYSIYKKLVDKGYNLDNIYDILAFRILVNKIEDCYNALRVVHSNFRPIPNRFKDYIAMPKTNGYQSLHTSVIDNDARIFEVQIRTFEMHNIAEEGIAAHFSYKKVSHEEEFDRKLNWLKEIVDIEKMLGSKFDVDFFGDEIFAFTPKGKFIELPKEASVIDFAYNIHSDIGEHCIGAKVNGLFASLKEKLENGDVVEILTSKNQKPSREWLKFTKTEKARTKIKHHLRESGKVSTRTYSTKEDVKKEIGESLLVFEGGNKGLKIKLALCCKPLPGDKIIGIKTSSVRIMVHKTSCNSLDMGGKKKIKIIWLDNFKEPVKIIVDAIDRSGIFKEVINSITKLTSINSAKCRVFNKNYIECSFMADVGTLDKLNNIISKINKIKDVKKVYLNIA